MRPIDADALKKSIEDFRCKDCANFNFVRCRACSIYDAIICLDEAPTIGGWISTQDIRRPHDSELCFVWFVEREQGTGRPEPAHYFLDGQHEYWFGDREMSYDSAAYWISLPPIDD